MAHTLTPRTRRRQEDTKRGIISPLQLYKVPEYKSLYFTPVSGLESLILQGAVVTCNLVLTCLLTQAEIVMLEICWDTETKGRANEEHVNERAQQVLTQGIRAVSCYMSDATAIC